MHQAALYITTEMLYTGEVINDQLQKDIFDEVIV